MNSILLAAATAAHIGERAVDLGSGVGAAGLALARRVEGLDVTLVEIDPVLAELAAENIARNGLAWLARAVCLDVAASAAAFSAAGLVQETADHVLMNSAFQLPVQSFAGSRPPPGAHGLTRNAGAVAQNRVAASSPVGRCDADLARGRSGRGTRSA